MTAGRCCYCGRSCSQLHITCAEHRDLLEVDELLWEFAPFRSWWLRRFTMPEILELAACLEPLTVAA